METQNTIPEVERRNPRAGADNIGVAISSDDASDTSSSIVNPAQVVSTQMNELRIQMENLRREMIRIEERQAAGEVPPSYDD